MHPAARRWLKDVASGKVYAAKRYRPADAPILFASLPLGTNVVPMAYEHPEPNPDPYRTRPEPYSQP